MLTLKFRPAKVPSKNEKAVTTEGISLEEFNEGCEGVPFDELRHNGCRAIVKGEKGHALYCNAKRIIGSHYWFCAGHTKYFFNR